MGAKPYSHLGHAMRTTMLLTITSLFWWNLSLSFPTTAGAFSLSSPTTKGHHHYQSSDCNKRTINSFRLYSSRNPSDDDLDDGDDDDDIDLSDRDWRAFRAQLVMDTKQVDDDDESKTSEDAIIFEDDLDGIGSLFGSTGDASSMSSSKNEFETEAMSQSNFTPLQPSQWAYDSGNVIEQGAVILGGVEQDFGFGLRQQYFHKAVILVLDHDEATFTKGIILNRPSDVVLMEEDEEDDNGQPTGKVNSWRIWFGGDVQGLDSVMPEIVCLHSIKDDDDVDEVSVPVMNDIQWTTFDQAKKLVKTKKNITPQDFWVFAGYAGWGPNQLMGELDRKSWYMCATDSQTLLKELAKQSAYTDPRDAGLDTWELLMTLIGRGETAEECSGDFEDLMLKEWARDNLLSVENGGGGSSGSGMKQKMSDLAMLQEIQKEKERAGFGKEELMRELMEQAKSLAAASKEETNVFKDASADKNIPKLEAGMLLRASSADRSPFLLKNQEYHKSIILVISEDATVTVGVQLNQPATTGFELELIDKRTSVKREISIPIRYGGPYAIRGGQGTLFWFHINPNLRAEGVGSPVASLDSDNTLIWKCKQDEAVNAIGNGLAKPSDFLIISGLSIWTKGQAGGLVGGMKDELQSGNFEVVPPAQVPSMWDYLKQQEVLTKLNLIRNLSIGNLAWKASGNKNQNDKSATSDAETVTDGIGEGFDEDDDSLVFKSNVSVAKLSDDALRSWVATFLLNAPTLGA